MATSLIQVNDYDAWGELVRSWAMETAPPPTTLDDLKSQCRAAGIDISIPSFIDKMDVVRMPKNTLLLRLPAKETVTLVEQELRAPGAKYPVPAYYDIAYGHVLSVPDPDKRVALQTCRIGEYSISMCG
jgi:hypothetical protein